MDVVDSAETLTSSHQATKCHSSNDNKLHFDSALSRLLHAAEFLWSHISTIGQANTSRLTESRFITVCITRNHLSLTSV